jgi:hypothetical protein
MGWRKLVIVPLLLVSSASGAELRVFPEAVSLEGSRDRQSVVVQAVLDDGTTRDVTLAATLALGDPQIARREGCYLLPVDDGRTTLRVTYQGDTREVPVSVQGASLDSPLSFRLDVMPILMRAGCNAGRCHGAARGKDGFRLSLYGFDPSGDYFRLAREIPGRRINRAIPEASLLLRKATGEVPHSGGERFATTSPYYQTLLRWLREGAQDDPASPARPLGIEVLPEESILRGPQDEQQLTVRAWYSDGTDRDVTDLAAFFTTNDNAAQIDEAGRIRAAVRGEALVMARFDTFTAGARVIVFPEGAGPLPPASRDPEEPEDSIDALIDARLAELGLEPSGLCTDAEFLRRSFIDLAGRLPAEEEHREFIRDARPDKRALLIDRLLASNGFTNLWTMRFGELLKIRTANQVSYKALLGLHEWVRSQIAANAPLDVLVRQLLSASGGTFTQPPANFYQIEANTLLLAENTAQSFLGLRIQCAQCHNHPFDRWTMDDYYGFVAFFSQVNFKQARDPRELIVYDRDSGEIRHPVDDRVVAPRFLDGVVPDLQGRTRREALAEWIASPDNPLFAQHMANLVWAHHFSRGIVEPADDVRISNPPSHPRLSAELGNRFAASGFDLRQLVREITLSNAYQRSTQPNDTNDDDLTYFSRGQVRRIRAEVLLDSISAITATQDRFPRMPRGSRAVEIADGSATNYFLSTFGRAPRETVCTCEVDVEPTLSQAFHLLNGDTTNRKIAQGGVVRALLAEEDSPEKVLERLYVRCFSRLPSAAEKQQLLATLHAADESAPAQQNPQAENLTQRNPEVVRGLEDILWALLNSKEFLFNH